VCPFCDRDLRVSYKLRTSFVLVVAWHLHASRPMRKIALSLAAPWAALLCLSLATAPARAEVPGSGPWAACAVHAEAAERAERMPRGLLRAIAKVESGRMHPDSPEVLAWPWTVMAEGRGRYLPSKAAAIAEVEALKARGIRNIDVGCMQINLYYHPEAFADLETAFDPEANVRAGARLLVKLRDDWGSWTRAVGNYHSNTPTLSGPYRVRVYRTLFKDRRSAARAELQRISD
jgi:soluble lytic murein transglycosylase-like protein